MVGTPQTSAASLAAARVRRNWFVGTSTLPPRWPHFFSDESWSSKCTAAAPASIIAFISSKALSGPPKPASASATIGASQYVSVSALGGVDLVGPEQSVVEAAHQSRPAVGGIQALIGICVAAEIGVGGDLPAGQVDRLQARLDHLHGLAAGQRAERRHVLLGVEQHPEPLRAEPGERVLDLDRAAQAEHVLIRVGDARFPSSARSPCRSRLPSTIRVPLFV